MNSSEAADSQAIGAYNGWRKGMTVADATAARWSGHCRNQNNLDYIFQYCNGWMQNKNAYNMGTYCEYTCSLRTVANNSQPQRLLNIPSHQIITMPRFYHSIPPAFIA
jgi:hypothetical protein